MTEPHYMFIDCEGSALFDYTKPADAPGQPRVCSVALIFTDADFEVQDERFALIRPDGWVLDPDCEAAKVNGLTQERLLAEGVPIRNMLESYERGIQAHRIVVGHNVAGYDTKIMRAELRHADMPDYYMKTRTICTMFGTRSICRVPNANGKGTKNPKLGEALAFFGVDPGESHTALDDARGCLGIMRKLRDMKIELPVKDPYEKGKK